MNTKDKFQNPVERAVFNICKKSFLSMWSYANPRKKTGTKELCDVLVVFHPYVIIFSIKHSDFNPEQASLVHCKRWWKKAIQESVNQIYGAERNLQRSETVTKSDGNPGLPLPNYSERVIHRISISLGSKSELPIVWGDFGKGFVHVFDEESFMVLLREVDTVSDFVHYITSKETFSATTPELIVEGFEKNLLAYYLFNNRSFPVCEKPLVICEDTWHKLISDLAYRSKKEADKISYFWDGFIEMFSSEILNDRLEFGSSLTDNERIVRFLARENRFHRRILSESYHQFRELAKEHKVIARIAPSPSGTTYVFFAPPPDMDREMRQMELKMRCFIARNDIKENSIVIGIGSNVEAAPKGFAQELVLIDMPDFSKADEQIANQARAELGFFADPAVKHQQFREYLK